MIKHSTKSSLESFKKCQELADRTPSPLRHLTKAQILKLLRKQRGEIWREKYEKFYKARSGSK